MLTSAIPAQAHDSPAVPLPVAGADPTLAAPPLEPDIPVSRVTAWQDDAALLLRERASLGPVFRRGERVILLDAAHNHLVLGDDGTRFVPLAREAALPIDLAVLQRALGAELGRWRPGTVRFQSAMAMTLARALVPAVTGLAYGSGPAERLANALGPLDDERSLLRRAMPRGLPSSPMGARKALAQGLHQAGCTAPGLLDAVQVSHATALRVLGALVRHLADTPDWQDTLRAEVRSAYRPAAGTGAAPEALELVDMATNEALRLMPGPLLVERRVVADVMVGEHRLEAGTLVAISPALTHADPALWPEPQRFDPLRFAGPRAAARAPGAWIAPATLPGAAGPAVLAAARLGIAHLLDRFALAPAGEGGKVLLRHAD